MGLTVALDVWNCGSEAPRGVVQHKRLYARALARLAKEGRLRVQFAGDWADRQWLQQAGLLQHANFRAFRIPGRLQRRTDLLKRLPLYGWLGQPELYHAFTPYPWRTPKMEVVGTLIDFVPLRVPEFVPLQMTMEQLRWCQWAQEHPERRWIASSEQIRQDAAALGRIDAEQVSRVALCADEDAFEQPGEAEIEATLEACGIQRPFLLCVNTLNPRKNHARLLEAWQKGQFHHLGWQLVLAGHPADNPLAIALHAGKFSGVTWLGYAPRPQVLHLYYGCEAFVYPSLYEGFGVPVAEAMVAGKAVLTSQRSPMAETAGEGAVIVDPWETGSIQAGLERLIQDESLRTRLGAYNYSRRERQSVSRLGEDLLSVYEKLVRTR